MSDGASVRFVIFAAPRTGSNLLCSLLNSHPEILCHHGLFNPAGIHYALDHRSGDLDFGSRDERDRDPETFIARVWRSNLNKPAAGFKLNRGENEIAARAVLHEPSVRKIVLERRNRIKTFVSEKIALETAEWESYGECGGGATRIHVDEDDLREHAAANQEYYARIASELRDAGQTYCRVFYESLAAGDLARVLSFLDRAPAGLIAGSGKRNSDDLRDLIANFDELAAILRGSEFEQDLYQLDSPRFSQPVFLNIGGALCPQTLPPRPSPNHRQPPASAGIEDRSLESPLCREADTLSP